MKKGEIKLLKHTHGDFGLFGTGGATVDVENRSNEIHTFSPILEISIKLDLPSP